MIEVYVAGSVSECNELKVVVKNVEHLLCSGSDRASPSEIDLLSIRMPYIPDKMGEEVRDFEAKGEFTGQFLRQWRKQSFGRRVHKVLMSAGLNYIVRFHHGRGRSSVVGLKNILALERFGFEAHAEI